MLGDCIAAVVGQHGLKSQQSSSGGHLEQYLSMLRRYAVSLTIAQPAPSSGPNVVTGALSHILGMSG